MLPVSLLVALDVVSAALTLVVAAFFLRAARTMGDPLHYLFAMGFALVGASFVTASATEFDLVEELAGVSAVRLAGQLGGALVLFFAYVSARVHGEARFSTTLGWGAAALSIVVGALWFVVPPFQEVPPSATASLVAHAIMVAAYGGCLAFSFSGFVRQPTRDRLLVPTAFLFWALTKYTWLIVDLTAAQEIIPLIYLWRFVAVGLLLAALVLPTRPMGGGPAAAA